MSQGVVDLLEAVQVKKCQTHHGVGFAVDQGLLDASVERTTVGQAGEIVGQCQALDARQIPQAHERQRRPHSGHQQCQQGQGEHTLGQVGGKARREDTQRYDERDTHHPHRGETLTGPHDGCRDRPPHAVGDQGDARCPQNVHRGTWNIETVRGAVGIDQIRGSEDQHPKGQVAVQACRTAAGGAEHPKDHRDQQEVADRVRGCHQDRGLGAGDRSENRSQHECDRGGSGRRANHPVQQHRPPDPPQPGAHRDQDAQYRKRVHREVSGVSPRRKRSDILPGSPGVEDQVSRQVERDPDGQQPAPSPIRPDAPTPCGHGHRGEQEDQTSQDQTRIEPRRDLVWCDRQDGEQRQRRALCALDPANESRLTPRLHDVPDLGVVVPCQQGVSAHQATDLSPPSSKPLTDAVGAYSHANDHV